MMKILVYLILFLSAAESYSQGSTFIFTSVGSTPQNDTALNYTGRIWGKFLNSSVPVKVNVIFTNLGSASNLAITIPNGRKDFTNAPQDSVWYPSSLANSLAGSELNSGEADMDIYVNTNVNWYTDTLGSPGVGQYDLVTVMLHEMGHGLAFLSLAKFDSNDFGSFGMVTASDILPIISSFPFPVLEGMPSTFAVFMENGNGDLITDTLLFPNNSIVLGDEFISNDIYFDGPLAKLQNGNLPVRLYAPTTFASGSSLEHLHEGSYPASDPNSLMTPFINPQEVHHHPGDLTIAMMEDMGWNVNYIQSTAENSDLHFTFFPNPAHDLVTIYPVSSNGKITITDISGRIVNHINIHSMEPVSVSVSCYDKGAYILQFTDENISIASKLIIE
jgi:hypothetical protein